MTFTLPSINNLPIPNLEVLKLAPITQNSITQANFQKPRQYFICPICSKTYTFKKTYLKHVASHQPHKQFFCKACNLQFARKDMWASHKISKKCRINTLTKMNEVNRVGGNNFKLNLSSNPWSAEDDGEVRVFELLSDE
ncbi:hypothetical protein CONCODRAFT_12977 [Conidiobolus coronatus NRRL 28638]|uniref:C2H2-type domain-containing protein n=1 Tax=Conidiobolus coronatus (strain ATCC 28846 / CBS 209.66 / NRRL 28638) TaxID=796925 RepID=A0A137NRR5_CONC2|nr:hypothetical protein CONCODRAFT_12977 [Conidiobolus coronatus NRRL 28638]|eukprot:KXN65428.1 hypothetical protein CONCODRAFT_12977 [Conidiobolus coronatus NRRL 28638]